MWTGLNNFELYPMASFSIIHVEHFGSVPRELYVQQGTLNLVFFLKTVMVDSHKSAYKVVSYCLNCSGE